MPETTPLGYPYPEDTDQVDVAGDIQALAEAVDTAPGVVVLNQFQIDSLPPGAIREGRVVFNTTTNALQTFTGDEWLYAINDEDPRLTNARTPTAHASTHGVGGSDPVTVAQSQVSGLTTALAAKAPLASPALTGTPTAPTATQATNNTQIATTAYVRTAVDGVVNAAPAALDTLNELATALGNDANFATTVTNSLATKAPLASPALTGTPTAPTAAADTTTTQVATTAFVVGQASTTAPPALGTAAVGTSKKYARSDHVHRLPTPSEIGAIAFDAVNAAGDLLVGSADNAVERLPLGSAGLVLGTNPSGTGAGKVAWVNPAPLVLTNATPQPLGTASVGTATLAARADHVHAAPFGGLQVQVGGTEPTAAAGYLWVDTSVEV